MSNKKIICNGDVCKIVYNKDKNKEFHAPDVNDEWTIYGAEYCSFCTKTKEYFKERNIKIKYYDIDAINKDKLLLLTDNYPTIPKIFNKNKFIGGFSELQKILK